MGSRATTPPRWSGERASAQLVRELQRRTEGNPLFLKEILRHVATHLAPDWFVQDDAATVLQRDLAPPGIRDLVAQRVGRLHPDTRAIFDAAAVLGVASRCWTSPIWSAGAWPRSATELEALRAQGFFQADRTPSTAQFTHPIVREAALALLSPLRSQQLHERAAKRLERAGADEGDAPPAAARLPCVRGTAVRIDRQGGALRKGRGRAAASHFAYEDAAGSIGRR